jgi:hypothetical protein
MTRDEVIAQAKVGGFATVRGVIVAKSEHGLQVDFGGASPVFVRSSQVVAIEPLPETDAQKIARLEARIAELEAQVLPNPAKRGK